MRIIEPAKPANKKIFKNAKTKPLKSKLIEVTTIGGEKIFHYDVYLEINKKQAILQNLEKIEINLIQDSTGYSKHRPGLFNDIDTSDTQEVNLVALNAARIDFDKTLNSQLTFGMSQVGEMSSDDVFLNENIGALVSGMLTNKTDLEVFGSKSRFVLKEEIQTNRPKLSFKNYLSQPRVSQTDELPNNSKFALKYTKLINSGQDPAAMLSKKYGSNTARGTLGIFKGHFSNFVQLASGGITSNLDKEIRASVESINLNNETSSKDFSLKLEKLPNVDAKLTQRVQVSESHLQKYTSDEIHMVFIARNNKNVKIESGAGLIEHVKEQQKIRFPKFDFEIEANRTATGKTTLFIKNNESHPRFFNVYCRQLNDYLPQEMIKFELKKTAVEVPARGKITLFRKGNYFKRNRPVFFRVNPVYEQKEYSNSKFASITTGRKLMNLEFAGISAIIQNDRIAIQVKNVSSSIKKIEVHRKDLSKRERTFRPTQVKTTNANVELKNNKVKFTKGNLDSIYTFYDDDVEYDHTYEYKAILYDDNGNKHLSSSSAIERYVMPSGLVTINASKRATGSIISGNREITIEGSVSKKQTDADRLFKDLFGKYYELFEDDLKNIRDLSGISINVLVEAINRDNSETFRMGEIQTDSEGNFSKNFFVPITSSIAVKLTPRVLPPAEILSKLTSNLSNLAFRQRFAPVSAFNTAAIKQKTGLRMRGVISAVGDKYSQRQSRVKGKIFDSKSDLNRSNFDTYYDGDTGDVFYLLDNGTDRSLDNTEIALSEQKIEYLELDNVNQQNENLKSAFIKEEYYLASFTLNNDNDQLDFLLMSFEENGNINFCSLAYMNNSTRHVNYVFKTPLLYGKISFYASPVLKNGETLPPALIKTIYKDDKGIK